jgi:prepilin-type N-terminal cleavage/methylation domain-containing protein
MKRRGDISGSSRSDLRTASSGFTMIELAVVILVLGILVSMGTGMIGPLIQRMKAAETKESLNAIMESMTAFAMTNGRLPNAAQFPAMTRSSNDSWGKSIQYRFDNNLTTSASAICNATTTGITVIKGPTTYSNVAFLILSGGPNYNNQTAAGGSVTPVTITTYDPGTANVDSYAGDFNRPEEYDDIVKWLTLPEVQAKVGCGPGTMAYEVWNSGAQAYFKVNGTGGCMTVQANSIISSFMQGMTINGFTDAGCTLSTVPPSIAFSEAGGVDANGNRRVNYNKTDR